jgi:hypothetical protein
MKNEKTILLSKLKKGKTFKHKGKIFRNFGNFLSTKKICARNEVNGAYENLSPTLLVFEL